VALKRVDEDTTIAASTSCSTTVPSSTHDIHWQSANACAIFYPRDAETVYAAIKNHISTILSSPVNCFYYRRQFWISNHTSDHIHQRPRFSSKLAVLRHIVHQHQISSIFSPHPDNDSSDISFTASIHSTNSMFTTLATETTFPTSDDESSLSNLSIQTLRFRSWTSHQHQHSHKDTLFSSSFTPSTKSYSIT
jgi:hypothetical protein